MATYRGQILLIVNVASKCGFTSQYAGKRSIAVTRTRGLPFSVFPATSSPIRNLTARRRYKASALSYDVTFPLFAKIEVNGSGAQPFHEITECVPKIAQKADERHLDDDEIIKAWREISKSSSSKEVKRALKLILVTAQRPGEVAQLHRNQIKDRWWTIPSEVAGKNEREHRVYLTEYSLMVDWRWERSYIPIGERETGAYIRKCSFTINKSWLLIR